MHTGSRGLGAALLDAQTGTESNPYISPGPSLDAYILEHDYGVQWAIANRDLVAHRIAQCILSNAIDQGEEAEEHVGPSRETLRKVVDVTHNSAVLSNMVVPGEEESRSVWIHRKGAAPSDKGVTPCPGSRGDFSWLLMPTGDGQHNGTLSAPHLCYLPN